MNNRNLFEALIKICGFTAIDDEMRSIKDAILKDFLTENVGYEIKPTKKNKPVEQYHFDEDLPF